MKLDLDLDEKASVPMSPLIDAVFLLLAFFLIATTYKKKDTTIDINLPLSNSAIKLPLENSSTAIGIDVNGELFLDGQPIRKTSLHMELQQISNVDPGRRIRLDADLRAPVHSVVELLELCQFRNLKNIGIHTYDGRGELNP